MSNMCVNMRDRPNTYMERVRENMAKFTNGDPPDLLSNCEVATIQRKGN